ncbi:MAG: outer membrane beta-barrel protein [Acidobacteriota bacterium]
MAMPVFRSALALTAACLLAHPGWAAEERVIEDENRGVQTPVQVNGFGVFDSVHDDTAGTDSFDAEKLALSLYKPLRDGFYFFGQATLLRGDVEVESEIDNLMVTFTPRRMSSLSISAGRFDAPVGFERDDEPLNLTASNSFNFQYGRPVKFQGIVVRQNFGSHLDLAAYVVNGWEEGSDNNSAKTVGLRVGWTPGHQENVGLTVIYGPEKDDNDADQRLLLNLDYTLQVASRWLLAGEGNYGSEENSGISGRRGRWIGGQLTSWIQLTRHWAALGRVEVLDDKDGVLTGERRTLRSYTVGANLRVSHASYGVFSVVEHTTIRIPQFALRFELRRDRATRPFFETGEEGVLDGYRTVATAQMFFVF